LRKSLSDVASGAKDVILVVDVEPYRAAASFRLDRDAHRAERELLEDLQRRASTHSSPDRDQLLEHPVAIELPATQIDDGLVAPPSAQACRSACTPCSASWTGHVNSMACSWSPRQCRSGIRRLLIQDAVAIARRNATVIDITANPDAIAFYRSVGFSEGDETATRFGLPGACISASRNWPT
jgi:hypothetical protein